MAHIITKSKFNKNYKIQRLSSQNVDNRQIYDRPQFKMGHHNGRMG